MRFLFQKLTSYPLVRKLIGTNNLDIIDILTGEQLFGNLLWSDIVKGAELLYNLIDCIQTNVQGMEDEKSLETEARILLKENRFLAGTLNIQ